MQALWFTATRSYKFKNYVDYHIHIFLVFHSTDKLFVVVFHIKLKIDIDMWKTTTYDVDTHNASCGVPHS